MARDAKAARSADWAPGVMALDSMDEDLPDAPDRLASQVALSGGFQGLAVWLVVASVAYFQEASAGGSQACFRRAFPGARAESSDDLGLSASFRQEGDDSDCRADLDCQDSDDWVDELVAC